MNTAMVHRTLRPGTLERDSSSLGADDEL